jgi:deoxyribodipyrimidine photo-lyase
MQKDVEQRGGKLLLRRGSARRVLPQLVAELDAAELHCSASYEPAGRALDEALAASLSERISLHAHRGVLLFEPHSIATQSGEPYRVFTPFRRACLEAHEPASPEPVPRGLRFLAPALDSDALEDWQLEPTKPDWAGGLRAAWRRGEHAARRRMRDFLASAVAGYDTERDRPDHDGTSRLSPHLHFGELSVRELLYAVRAASAAAHASRGAAALERELVWREFCAHLLYHWPALPEQPFRPEFARFPWRDDADALARWQRGATGYPLVDAGMRQLWQTGWMHNRVRMVAASLLVKHLLVPWQVGAAWFLDTLVDADLANNSANWQWVAGSGADAAPYFRIFNPELQGKKFDPDGDYVRRWVPELAKLPTRYLHAPSSAPEKALKKYGVTLGIDYENTIVPHRDARERALAAFHELRDVSGAATASAVVASRGRGRRGYGR